MDARPIPNDAMLVWMASERTAPLFRTLDRTRAFSPLIVLLSVVPPILATFAEVVTPEDAAWGLRALDATGSALPPAAANAVNAVVPADRVQPAALWLTAGLLEISNPARPVSTSLASLIGGGVLLSLLWPLAKSLGGRRFAFWAVLIAAFHPTLISLLLDPVPITVALSTGVAALWAHLTVNGRPVRVLLTCLLLALSIAAGLILIGPVGIVIPAVIVADAGLALFISGRNPGDQRMVRGAIGAGRIAIFRIVAAFAGVAIGLLLEQIIPDLSGVAPSGVTPSSIKLLADELRDLPPESVLIGPLWGLAVIGFGRLLRVLSRGIAQRASWPAPRLLFVWTCAGATAVLWTSEPEAGGFDPVNRYATALFGLPFLLIAAYAIEEASRRMISGAWVLLAIALPLAVRVGGLMATFSIRGPSVWIFVAIAAVATAWLIAKVVPAIVPQTGMRRGALMSAVLIAIAVNSIDGVGVLFRPQRDDGAYRRLIAALETLDERHAAVLLTPAIPPPELVYALRASFPDAAMEVASSWDEAAARLEGQKISHEYRVVVAAWDMRDGVGAKSAEILLPTGEPLLFSGRELLLYASTRDRR